MTSCIHFSFQYTNVRDKRNRYLGSFRWCNPSKQTYPEYVEMSNIIIISQSYKNIVYSCSISIPNYDFYGCWIYIKLSSHLKTNVSIHTTSWYSCCLLQMTFFEHYFTCSRTAIVALLSILVESLKTTSRPLKNSVDCFLLLKAKTLNTESVDKTGPYLLYI